MRLRVRLTPRGGADRVEGWIADADGAPILKVRVACPPVEGEANAALIRLMAKTLGVAPSAVRLAAGAKARVKTLDIDGVDEAEARARLG